MKTVAITGPTGGLGKEICLKLASEKYNLILISRNKNKNKVLINEILYKYPNTKIQEIICDLEDMRNVVDTCEELKNIQFDFLILNAGIYNIPVKKLGTGYNNIFQVNFISEYYLARELASNYPNLKIVATGSIAHNYSKLDENDIDFSTRKKPSKIYGNSKRFLMFALFELFKDYPNRLSIVHPGVTLTNMTNHYPKWINWLVKIVLGIFCPNKKSASKNIVAGIETDCKYLEWIGPRILNVWGKPKVQKLKTCDENERIKISNIANDIFKKIKKQ